MFFPVYHYLERLFKTHMPDELILINNFHPVQIIHIIIAFIYIRVNCEISYSEGCQVLEKMSSLAWVNTVVFQPRFNNNPCRRDLLPFYRYAKPWICRAPSSGTDKYISQGLLNK